MYVKTQVQKIKRKNNCTTQRTLEHYNALLGTQRLPVQTQQNNTTPNPRTNPAEYRPP
jgi:hypothetical protein